MRLIKQIPFILDRRRTLILASALLLLRVIPEAQASDCPTCGTDRFHGGADLTLHGYFGVAATGDVHATITIGDDVYPMTTSLSGPKSTQTIDDLDLPIDSLGNISIPMHVWSEDLVEVEGDGMLSQVGFPGALVVPKCCFDTGGGLGIYKFRTTVIYYDEVIDPDHLQPLWYYYHWDQPDQTDTVKIKVRLDTDSANDPGASTPPGPAAPAGGGGGGGGGGCGSGCGDCSGGAGGGDSSAPSVPPIQPMVGNSYSLGRDSSGIPSGRVSFSVDSTSGSVSRSSLTLSATDSAVAPIQDPANSAVLRQVISTQCLLDFTDITVGSVSGIRVSAYDPTGAILAGGIYTPAGTALKTTDIVPATATIGSTTVNGVKFLTTNASDGSVDTYEYYAQPDASHGGISRVVQNGRITDTVVAATLAGDGTVTGKIVETVHRFINQDHQEVLESERVENYEVFPWGISLVSSADDPNGRNRTSQYEYYASVDPSSVAYGTRHIQLNSDGSWTRNVLDSQTGTRTAVYRPWIGSPTDFDSIRALTEDQCDATVYSTDPLNPNKTTAVHKITGTIVSSTVTTSISTMDYDTGLPLTQKTTATYLKDGTLATWQNSSYSATGDLVYSTNADGTTTHYQKSIATVAGDPYPETTTVVTHGTTAHPDGVPRQSIQTVTVSNQNGLISETTNVALGGGAFAPLQKRRVERTPGVQPLETDYLDDIVTGTTQRLSNTILDQRLDSTKVETTDEVGAKTQTEMDPSGEVKTLTRYGVNQAPYMNGSNLVTTNSKVALASGAGYTQQTHRSNDAAGSIASVSYNGLGEVSSESNADSTVVRTHTYADSTSGRYLNAINARGGAYSAGAGATTYNSYYPNGLMNSVQGYDSFVETHTYAVDGATGNRVETVATLGALTTTDGLGRVVKEQKGSRTMTHVYNAKGQRIKTIHSGNGSENAPTLYEYDETGQLFRQGVDLNGNGVLDVNSNEPITEYLHSYEQVGGSWWQVNRTRVYFMDGASQCRETETRRKMGAGVNDVTITIQSPGVTTTQSVSINRSTHQRVTTTTRSDSSYSGVRTEINGLLVSESSANGPLATTAPALTSYCYDSRWRCSQMFPPDMGGASIAYTYDDCDRVLTEVSSDSTHRIQNTYAYYPAGHPLGGKLWKKTSRPTRCVTPSVTCYYYNDRGLLTWQWGLGTLEVQYGYDGLGRMTWITWNSSLTPSLPTDVPVTPGSISQVTAGGMWAYWQDTNLPYLDSFGIYAGLTYNDDGTLQSCTTPSGGSTTSFGYDSMKRVISKSYTDGTSVSFTYHRDGSIATVTDAAGLHTFTQDPATGQLGTETITAAPGTVSQNLLAGVTVQHGYDSAGRRSSLAGSINGNPLFPTVNIGYGAGGNVGTISSGNLVANYAVPTSSSGQTQSISRTTSPTSAVAALNSTDISGTGRGRYSSSHTAPSSGLGFSTSVNDTTGTTMTENATTLGMGGYWTYTFDSKGQVTGARRFSLNTAAQPYTNATQNSGTTHELAGWGTSYGYDGIGNRTSMLYGLGTYGVGPVNGNPGTVPFGSSNRVLQVLGFVQSSDVSVNGSAGVVRTSASPWGPSPTNYGATMLQKVGTLGYYFSSMKSISSSDTTRWYPITVQSGTGSAAVTRTGHKYLPPLNEASGGRYSYTWNGETQLTQMTTQSAAVAAGVPNLRLSFAYDALGRRIQKLLEEDKGSGFVAQSDTRFVYDGWNVVAEIEALSTAADAPPGQGAPFVRRSYLWGPDMSGSWQGAGGVGGLLAIRRSAHTTFPASSWWTAWDLNGNIVGLSEVVASGTPRYAVYEYDPYGQSLRVSEPEEDLNPFRFSTKYQDVESDLYYYGYRYYDPRRGRWLSQDPLGMDAGINNYGFCGNNGVSNVDYLGLDWDVKRDKTKPRVQAIPDVGETVANLARKYTYLEPSEYKKWLKREGGGELPASETEPITAGCVYTVPNTMVAIQGAMGGLFDGLVADEATGNFKTRMESLKYKVSNVGTVTTQAEFLEKVKNEDMAGLHIVAHGNYHGYTLYGGKEVYGDPTGSILIGNGNGEGVNPPALIFALKFKLALLYLNVCGAGALTSNQSLSKPQNAWNSAISKYGTTYATTLQVDDATVDGGLQAFGPPGGAAPTFLPFTPSQ